MEAAPKMQPEEVEEDEEEVGLVDAKGQAWET